MGKIVIVNKTQESTKLLRELTKLVAKNKGVSDNIHVRFVKSKCNQLSGTAYIGQVTRNCNIGRHRCISKMSLTKNFKDEKLLTFLQIFHHEFGHTLGLKHRDMLPFSKIEIPYIEEAIILIKKYGGE